jgi:hypothetical protein
MRVLLGLVALSTLCLLLQTRSDAADNKEVQKLRHELKERAQHINKLEALVKDLRQDLQRAKSADNKEDARFRSEINKLHQEVKELRAENMRLRTSDNKEDAKFKAEIARLQQELARAKTNDKNEDVKFKADIARLQEQLKEAQAPFVHVVIFYLKQGTPAAETKKLMDDAHAMLNKVPGVRHLWVGKPEGNATPVVAVKDYTLGLMVLFDDANALQRYLTHADHKRFEDKYKDRLEKVLVYDFSSNSR